MKTITLGKRKFTFSLRIINTALLIISAALAITLLIINHRSSAYYERVRLSTERYQVCTNVAAQLQQASTFLTGEVRAFVVTGNDLYLNKYFKEVNEDQNREKAVETLNTYYQNSQLNTYLERALRLSNELAEREIYAMRLAVEGLGYDLSSYPRELQKAALSQEDLSLSANEKLAKAQNTVFDSTYQNYVDQITDYIKDFSESLSDVILAQQEESSARFTTMLHLQQFLVVALLISTFATVLLVTLLILRPLQKSVASITRSEKMKVAGLQEMRILADGYNHMLKESQDNQRQLSYEANHDPLTGVNNRGVFDRLCGDPTFGSERCAMMLADIDHFKEINDTYGHGVGDKVLVNLASLLVSSFRSNDYVCRIGGDEFAVFLFGISHDQKQLIQNKIGSISNRLSRPETDEVPPVTISVGVAFGEKGSRAKDLYKNADTALYRVKNSGKNGLKFY